MVAVTADVHQADVRGGVRQRKIGTVGPRQAKRLRRRGWVGLCELEVIVRELLLYVVQVVCTNQTDHGSHEERVLFHILKGDGRQVVDWLGKAPAGRSTKTIWQLIWKLSRWRWCWNSSGGRLLRWLIFLMSTTSVGRCSWFCKSWICKCSSSPWFNLTNVKRHSKLVIKRVNCYSKC